jgi:primosomal protein N'
MQRENEPLRVASFRIPDVDFINNRQARQLRANVFSNYTIAHIQKKKKKKKKRVRFNNTRLFLFLTLSGLQKPIMFENKH